MTEPERKPVYHCSWCGNEIYAGDPYYEIAYMGIVCERCMDECNHCNGCGVLKKDAKAMMPKKYKGRRDPPKGEG